jgi:hypothetical protein
MLKTFLILINLKGFSKEENIFSIDDLEKVFLAISPKIAF